MKLIRAAFENAAKEPWHLASLPIGYQIDRQGVFSIPKEDSEKERIKISGPIWVLGFARNDQGSNWGILLQWIDRDGKEHEKSVPLSRLHEQGNGLVQDLALEGLEIVPGREKKLFVYLGASNSKHRFQCVSRLGWMDHSKDRLVYILPQETVSLDSESEKIIFQPERHSPTANTIHAQGDFKDWQKYVAFQTLGNPLLLFSLCTAFAGPLLKFARLDSGGFHFYGRSSHGKTTALQVAASVWGCGADPSEAPESAYIRRWNATSNAFEGLAAAHNDALLILDELGTCAAKDFGKVIYDLTGGQGKAALDANRSLKPVRSWRLLFLSSGEISARQKMEEEQKNPKAGQLLRMIDIPIRQGVIQSTEGEDPQSFVGKLKRSCSQSYGIAGPLFIKKLIEAARDFTTLKSQVDDLIKDSLASLQLTGLETEQSRALQKFALVEVAGSLAADFQIIPFSKKEVQSAVRFARDAWLEGSEILSDAGRAIDHIRQFILRHRNRFGDPAFPEAKIFDLVGYYDQGKELYLFLKSGLREALQGISEQEALRELHRLGFLLKNEATRYTSKHRILMGGTSRRINLYAIRGEILGEERHETRETAGQTVEKADDISDQLLEDFMGH